MSDKNTKKLPAEKFNHHLDELIGNIRKGACTVKDEETGQLLKLSESMLQMDWSKGSRVKETLKQKLESMLFIEEISEDELDWVAGGLQSPDYHEVKEEEE